MKALLTQFQLMACNFCTSDYLKSTFWLFYPSTMKMNILYQYYYTGILWKDEGYFRNWKIKSRSFWRSTPHCASSNSWNTTVLYTEVSCPNTNFGIHFKNWCQHGYDCCTKQAHQLWHSFFIQSQIKSWKRRFYWVLGRLLVSRI